MEIEEENRILYGSRTYEVSLSYAFSNGFILSKR